VRRREKFVVTSIVLSLGLLIVQAFPLDQRYWAVAGLAGISYLFSGWALSEDLQWFEWFTIMPLPALYAGAVGLFYFLLPSNILTRAFILALFGIGTYGLLLTANIYSVAKGRTIQLVHAATSIGLLFTLLTMLLITNTIFSLRLPFYSNAVLVGLTCFPLVLSSLWSVEIEQKISKRIWVLTGILTLVFVELTIGLSFLPLSIWNASLLLMALLYVALGVVHNYLKNVLFSNTVAEYSLVAGLIGIMFILMFPLK
jgi:hypothetical protein